MSLFATGFYKFWVRILTELYFVIAFLYVLFILITHHSIAQPHPRTNASRGGTSSKLTIVTKRKKEPSVFDTEIVSQARDVYN